MDELRKRLLDGELLAVGSWRDSIPDCPGYYSIHLADATALPIPYAALLRQRETQVIYVGIATKSLARRLLAEDLRHRRPSTFCRSLGAVLGYRPTPGSLKGAKRASNFRFGVSDTDAIRGWIDEYLMVSVVLDPDPSKADERQAIAQLRPLLNITHNPMKLTELEQARRECRRIAAGA